MRRASVWIASNIAGVFSRAQIGFFIRFLRVAQGSLKKLETLVALTERVSLLQGSAGREMNERWGRVDRMLVALIRALEAKDQNR
jgi:four helix bundle protein